MDIVSKINGNTLSATEFNQIPTELEVLQTSSGLTSSDAILNQVSIATSRYSANNFYIDSGSANAYVLTLAASMTNPVSATVPYYVGMTIRFRAGNANTGASTVNVNSAGVKNLKKEDGTTDLAAGDIPTTQDSIFRYDGTSFVLQRTTTKAPAVTVYSSGSGNYTVPAGTSYLRVQLLGGGGGGAGGNSGGAAPAASNGGNTTFNSITANGGSGAPSINGGAGGTGGAGTAAYRNNGNPGRAGYRSGAGGDVQWNGTGGDSPFGFGQGGWMIPNVQNGTSGTGFGSGGGGGSVNATNCGGGGGSGEYAEFFIQNPTGTYAYSVGAAGAGSASTTSGGPGASGLIIVSAY